MPRKLTEGDRRGGGTAMPQPHGGAIGNPPHIKTAALIQKVKMLRALGNSYEVIALACDISVDTLTRHYRDELAKAEVEANARVGAAIFNEAVGTFGVCQECIEGRTEDGRGCRKCDGTGQVLVREPNITAGIWWSKNRMGWTDQQRIEHTGPDGGPMIHEQRDAGAVVRKRLDAIRKRIANDEAA